VLQPLAPDLQPVAVPSVMHNTRAERVVQREIAIRMASNPY